MTFTKTISTSRIYEDWLCSAQTLPNTVPPNHKQSDAAHALRLESVRLHLDRSMQDKVEAEEESLKNRMAEFLAGIPSHFDSLGFVGAFSQARERGRKVSGAGSSGSVPKGTVCGSAPQVHSLCVSRPDAGGIVRRGPRVSVAAQPCLMHS
jgi:hypothetical protein